METMTVTQTAAAFLEHLKGLGKAERTIYTYRKDLDIVEAFFHGERPLLEIRVPQVGKFFKSELLLKKPTGVERAPRTVEKTVRVFRMMMVWSKETGLITELPLPKNTPMGHSTTGESIETVETEAHNDAE